MHDDRQKPLFVLLDGPVTVRLDIADILSKQRVRFMCKCFFKLDLCTCTIWGYAYYTASEYIRLHIA